MVSWYGREKGGSGTYHDHVLSGERLGRSRCIRVVEETDDGETRICVAGLVAEIVSDDARELVTVGTVGPEHLFHAGERFVLDVKLMLVVEANGVQEDVFLAGAVERFGESGLVVLGIRRLVIEITRHFTDGGQHLV